MSRNRFATTSRSEHFSQFAMQARKSNSPAAIHSPRRGLIGGSVPNQLHRTPVAVAVSATGERTLCPIDAVSGPMNLNNTNPFANEQKESLNGDTTSEEVLQNYPTKRQRAYQQRRRKLLEKERRKSAKIILTQRNSARPKLQIVKRSVSSQTDPSITGINRPPECVGDPGILSRERFGRSLTRVESRPVCTVGEMSAPNKKLHSIDNFFAQFMPESLKILTSFMIMIILIFWITSVILDVEVPSDFFRMAANYVRSFKWGHYRKQPQTNAEKCLEYVTNFFK